MRFGRIVLGVLTVVFSVCACSDDDAARSESGPVADGAQQGVAEPLRQPRPELVASLREARSAPRHPSDGGGRAVLLEGGSAVAGAPGRWTFLYEAGPEGVAAGGTVDFQVSPFWGWTTPQVLFPEAPGYTEVSSEAVVEPATVDEQLLRLAIGEGGLAPGQTVEIRFGAGPSGARADRFSEQASRFWFAVDGDGDGVRKVLADSPAVPVRAGAPARLLFLGPATARAGETVDYRLSVVDALGNAGVDWAGTIDLDWPDGWQGPAAVEVTGDDRATVGVRARVSGSGVGRPRARTGSWDAEAPPLLVSEGARVLWGDLQSHSSWSDGTGEPAELHRYAREVAALDVFALTDHDHWGFLFLDEQPELRERIRAAVRAAHERGRFVAFLGYEWTNWVHGHRHVLWLDDPEPAPVFPSSIDPETDTPEELWEALCGQNVMTIAHHPAGGPISTDWSTPPHPSFEPVVEIVSVHGSSEAVDAPTPIYRPVAGNWVRDALARGYRLGFVGSTDGHDGHPGLGHLASPSGGIVGILAEELTREAVAAALRARRTWATNGPRILVRGSFGGYPVGSEVPVGPDGAAAWPGSPIPAGTLVARVVAPGELARVEIVDPEGVVGALDCSGRRDCSVEGQLDVRAGEVLYLRALQADGGAAWTSPWFFVDATEDGGEGSFDRCGPAIVPPEGTRGS